MNKRNAPGASGTIGAAAWTAWLLLLVGPGYALSRLATPVDGRILAAVMLATSLAAFFAYRSDKLRAEAGGWRIPEVALHGLELLGGWPGAFLAQRKFRHKTAKLSYQLFFWIIVAVHQFAAWDSVFDWQLTRQLTRG